MTVNKLTNRQPILQYALWNIKYLVSFALHSVESPWSFNLLHSSKATATALLTGDTRITVAATNKVPAHSEPYAKINYSTLYFQHDLNTLLSCIRTIIIHTDLWDYIRTLYQSNMLFI